MSDSLSFALGVGTGGLPLTDQVLQDLQAALKGGDATATYINDQRVLQNFYSWLAGQPNNQAWTASTDTQGNPVLFAAQASGESQIALVIRPVIDQEVIGGAKPASVITVNGAAYNVVGAFTVSLEYDETPAWVIKTPLGLADHIALDLLLHASWPDLLKPMIAGFGRAVQSCFNSIPNVADMTDAQRAAYDAMSDAERAAYDAAAEGAVETSALSLVVGAGAAIGLMGLLLLPAVIDILSHTTCQSVQVYNLTPYDVTWDLAYVDHGAMCLAPADASGDQNTLIPATWTDTQADGSTVTVASQANFGFTSSSELAGIGYVLTFTLTDPASGAAIDTAAAMFDIPLDGSNSLAAATGPLASASDWYSDNAGSNKVTQMVQTGKGYTITITYDYLTGQHEGPDGEVMFWYNSLIAFTPTS